MADPLRTGASMGARARRRYLEARRAVGSKLRDRLGIDENDSVLARVSLDGWVTDDVAREDRARWVEHYFGDVTPGASMRRFLETCEDAIGLRDKLVTTKRDRLGADS